MMAVILRRRRAFLSVVVTLFLVAAKQRAVRPGVPLEQPLPDAFSYSEPLKAIARHLSLDLTIDTSARVARGTATLQIENLANTPELVLDTWRLAIESVSVDGAITDRWHKGAEGEYGAPLRIEIPPGTSSVAIRYASDSTAQGLVWAQSDVSVYSLNSSIRARSWIPIQDTPAARMTYDATLRVPAGQIALMSAGDNPRTPNSDGVYHFEMRQSVPAYLIAFAAGNLVHHAFDERTGVYAPAGRIQDAAWQLQDLPEMFAAAERLLGPHPFPRHDLLIMPSTFFYAGMEHPMLNFIYGAFLNGVDRSAPPEPNVLIAHELAHSWAGDSTTLSTWQDVWLNEGFASYLALRIIEEMSGAERVQTLYARDRRDYETWVRGAVAATTILHRKDIANPNEGFDFTSYKKGQLFLRTLEDTFGRETFDGFLDDYFARFAFRWVDERNFVARLRQHVGDAALANARVHEWIYLPGLPSNVSVSANSGGPIDETHHPFPLHPPLPVRGAPARGAAPDRADAR